MTIIDKIETSKATVRQIALLASIPEGRVYKWAQRKSEPNGEDLKKVEGVLQLISNISKDELKKAVYEVSEKNKSLEQALKIATGNSSVKVEDLEEDEGSRKYINSVNNGTKLAADKAHPKTDQDMTVQIAGLMHMAQQMLNQRDKDLAIADKLVNTINVLASKIPDVDPKETVDQ